MILSILNEIHIDSDVNNDVLSNGLITENGKLTALGQMGIVFRESLINSDIDDKYIIRKEKVIKDPLKIKEIEESMYGKRKEASALYAEFKAKNDYMFKKIKNLTSMSNYLSVDNNKMFSEIKRDPNIVLALMRIANKEKEEYYSEMDKLNKIAKTEKTVVLPEFKDVYDKYRAEVKSDLGILDSKDIKDIVTDEVKVVANRLRTNVQHKFENDMEIKEAESIVKEYIDVLLSTYNK